MKTAVKAIAGVIILLALLFAILRVTGFDLFVWKTID